MSDVSGIKATAPPAAQPTQSKPATEKSTNPSSAPPPSEKVQLSRAAQTALQESLETPAQTAKEAGTGDMQAKRMLAKEAAAKGAGSSKVDNDGDNDHGRPDAVQETKPASASSPGAVVDIVA